MRLPPNQRPKFDASDWYWTVPGSGVFASKRGRYVPEHDADYQSFIASGCRAKPVDSEETLIGLLGPLWPGFVPVSVTNYQARAALINAGLFADVDALVKEAGTDSIVYQAWEYAATIERNSPFIQQ